jgi:hypothetical protein
MPKPVAVIPHPRELTESDIEFIAEMAERRAELVRRMKAALEAHDDVRALALAREVAGIEEEGIPRRWT